MRYFDANFNHDEIGIAGGLYYHRSCAAKADKEWQPADNLNCTPKGWNHCQGRGDGCCEDSFIVVTEVPAPENEHFI